MTTDTRAVIVEHRDGVAIVRLNAPETLNALTADVKAGLANAVEQIAADESTRAVLITGTGRAFCAGGDLRGMTETKTLQTRRRMQSTHTWLQKLLTFEIPVITAVNGVAAGAGFSLALLGDIVYAADDAKFKAGFPNVGAAPDLAIGFTLPRAVGAIRAREILLTNRDVTASEALAMGLVARLFPAATLLDEALAVATRLAAGPSVSFGQTKRLVARAFELPLEAFLEQEAHAQTLAFGSDDFQEGRTAFLAKRKPRFNGK